MVFLFASCGPVSLFFLLFCFVFMCFSFFSKKDPQKTGHGKNPQKQKCRKKRTKKSVSAAVFTNSVPYFLGGLKVAVFAENSIRIVVSVSFVKGKMAPKRQKG